MWAAEPGSADPGEPANLDESRGDKEIGGVHVAIADSTKQTTAQFVELSHKMDAMRRWGVGSVVAVAGAVVGSGCLARLNPVVLA